MSKKIAMRWTLRGANTVHIQVQGPEENRSYGFALDVLGQEFSLTPEEGFTKWVESNIVNDTQSLATAKPYTVGSLKVTKCGDFFIRLNKKADWTTLCTCSLTQDLFKYVKANGVSNKKAK